MAPTTKTCTVSGKVFTIDERDLAFYAKINVPLPTLCPEERERRRWAWRGKNFHIRKCDKCQGPAMSYFSPNINTIKTYCETCFLGDEAVTDLEADFDFSRPFFEQFMELYYQVPKNAGNIGHENQNSQYIICSCRNRDCYLVDETDECQDCAFCYNVQNCKDIIASIYVRDSEIGYQLKKAENCYACFFSENIFHCHNSAFLKNCRSCRHCLFCTDLNSKEYHIFNKPVSKEEYEKYWQFIFSHNRQNLAEAQTKWAEFLKANPTSDQVMVQAEGCSGNYITNSKDCQDCYFIDNCRDCRYCSEIHHSKDCYDISIYEGELMYETLHAGPKGYGNYFCQLMWFCSDVYYSIECWNSKDCFGCTGLKNRQYCILNKQYSKDEYFALRDKIIAHMRETGEYGEFFPTKYSPHAYNHTMAQRFYPSSGNEAANFGMSWDDDWEAKLRKLATPLETNIPENPQLVTHTETFKCAETGKDFRFIPTELAFYQKWGLPCPTNDPLIRLENLWSEMIQKRKIIIRV